MYMPILYLKSLLQPFDNARAHGEHVTEIIVSSRRVEDSLVIEIKDNGIGVPPEMKELIFEKSVGKNTGLGLFLVRGILSITELEIRETGIEGKGATFEITAPPGNWRINTSQ